MKICEVRKLHKGDEVFWNDPDNNLCSRFYIINTIEFIPPNIIRIIENNNSLLECYARELS